MISRASGALSPRIWAGPPRNAPEYTIVPASAVLFGSPDQGIVVIANVRGFHPTVDRDAHVAKGAKVGVVTDYVNRPLQDVIAPEAGILMFIRAVPSLKKGDTLANIGVVKMGR